MNDPMNDPISVVKDFFRDDISMDTAMSQVTSYADTAYYELRNRLQSIRGVIAPAVYGGKLRRILAYIDPKKLQARNLSPMDVVNALSTQNVSFRQAT